MLILTAHNITPGNGTDANGNAEYDVWVGINKNRIWGGNIKRHRRADGAAVLLQLIADKMDPYKTHLHHLQNLLAVIHRDGGHYVGEHGLDKAVEDAINVVYAERLPK